MSWVEGLREVEPDLIAIDGKTSLRSHARSKGREPLHLVSAWASHQRLVLGQEAVAGKSNEITAIPLLLERLALKGALVTIDAIGAQNGIATSILERGGDYLLALKANRPATFKDVETFFADPPPGALDTCTTTDGNHGRIEIRRHAVCHDVAWLFSDRRYPGEVAFPGLAMIGIVASETEREGKLTRERRYYLSSAKLDAAAFARAVRGHWGIENRLHWVLDVVFKEDRPACAPATRPRTWPWSDTWPPTCCTKPSPRPRSRTAESAPAGTPPTSRASSGRMRERTFIRLPCCRVLILQCRGLLNSSLRAARTAKKRSRLEAKDDRCLEMPAPRFDGILGACDCRASVGAGGRGSSGRCPRYNPLRLRALSLHLRRVGRHPARSGLSTGLDFENDTEVHVLVRGKHDATGVEYGGRIELEADTNASNNTDETWIFLRGGFGEFRLGDEDGIADEDGMAVSAASVAAGTGGLDGTQVDTYVTRAFEPFGTSDATKAIYRSPSFGGFGFGASYTPNLSTIDNGSGNGDSLASKDVQAGDIVEGGVGYEGDIGGMATEIALTGLYGDVKDEATFGEDDYWAGQIGASVDFGAFSLAGSFLKEKIGEAEQDAYTLGAAYEIGPLALSINYAQSFNTEQRPTADFEFDNPATLSFRRPSL